MDLELVTKGKQLSDNDQAILTYLANHVLFKKSIPTTKSVC